MSDDGIDQETSTFSANIECPTRDIADKMRAALSDISGVNVDDEILAKSGAFDFGMLVTFTASAAISVAVIKAVISILSKDGYSNIKINGKVTVLSVAAIEVSIQAKKPENIGNPKQRPAKPKKRKDQKKT